MLPALKQIINYKKPNKMEQQNYFCSISASITPKEAFDKINDVSGWWAKHLEGNTKSLNDVFTVRFGVNQTYATFRVTESVPGKKIVWDVIDCYLHWIEAKKEWNGTQLVFDISAEGDSTKIDITHVGLLPEVECYNDCEAGWNHHLKGSLLKFMNENKGVPV